LRAVDIHMWAVGRYEGELVKLDGDWLIAKPVTPAASPQSRAWDALSGSVTLR
jgi:hypothetical protein